MTKGKNMEKQPRMKDDRPRLVATVNNEEQNDLLETFEILRIKMKDENNKPIYKNRNEVIWAAVKLFIKTHYSYLDMPKPYTISPATAGQ